MKSNYIWIDGNFVSSEEARGDILAPAGPAENTIFEDIRCYNTPDGPAVFRIEDHLSQFMQAARQHGHELVYSMESLCETVYSTMAYNAVREGNVRPVLIFNGRKSAYRQTAQQAGPPSLAIAAWEWDTDPEEEKDEIGLDENTDINDSIPDRAALFVVQDGVIYTPPSEQFGNKVVRDSIITLAEDLGYQVQEKPLVHRHVYQADEAFISTRIAVVKAVRELGGNLINAGNKGPVTRLLQSALFETTHGRGRRSREWLDWVQASYLGL